MALRHEGSWPRQKLSPRPSIFHFPTQTVVGHGFPLGFRCLICSRPDAFADRTFVPQLGQAWVNARTTTPSLTRNCWPQCPATWTFPVRTPLYIFFLGNKGIRTPSVRPRGLSVVRAPAHVLACVLPRSPFFFLYALDAPQPPPVSLLLLLEFAHAQPAELLPPSPRRPCDVFVAAWHSLSFVNFMHILHFCRPLHPDVRVWVQFEKCAWPLTSSSILLGSAAWAVALQSGDAQGIWCRAYWTAWHAASP